MSVVIKKRRYWPAGVKGNKIIKYFEDKEIGLYDALPGQLDDVPFHIVYKKRELCHEPNVDVWYKQSKRRLLKKQKYHFHYQKFTTIISKEGIQLTIITNKERSRFH